MLHCETVLPGTLGLLKTLQAHSELKDMRLVGGTALALQIGHRASVDIDLFGNFDGRQSFRRILSKLGHRVEGVESGEVQSLIVDDVKVDLVNYPYPWISNPVVENGVVLAGRDDVAAMKLSAVANRGKKKDFIDIAFLLDRYSLLELFDLYKRKFAVSEISFALRGLTYFDDAEDDPMPKMFVPVKWGEIKAKIGEAVRNFANFA